MKLSDYFNALCDDHELTSISVDHSRYNRRCADALEQCLHEAIEGRA